MTRFPLPLAAAATLFAAAALPAAVQEKDFDADARAIEALVNANYAYSERLQGGRLPLSAKLRAEAEAVSDRSSLLRYAERALATLADHHAITGSAFADSWALVPSQADLWVEPDAGGFAITAVRAGSPAAAAGVSPRDRLESVDGVATAEAVRAFWADLGLEAGGDRIGYAARVLAAGRRDRPRRLGISRDGIVREIVLPNHTSVKRPPRSPVTLVERRWPTIRIEDSLGGEATVAAFDAAMARVRGARRLTIDLTDTPSGGNTVVARALLGWFVDRPTIYQVHNLPGEERRTGIARQWAEQVLPREGKHFAGRVEVRVGRWTGSMGEGLAVAFDAIGAKVRGDPMAGLLGAIYDYRLDHSGLVIKFPAERLTAPDGTPRERFVPKR